MDQNSQWEDPTEDPIIEVRDTTVRFDMDRGTSRVLDNVSLDIERNEILGVVGESGSGKSMFASALLDAVVRPGRLNGEITYYPESGEAVDVLDLDDGDLRALRWEEIAMVFQGAMSSFNPTLTIRGHFAETLKHHGYDEEGEGIERARELLSDLYMDPDRVLDSYAHELSGGMRQRALIALSLVLEPSVLVMDEPTASLDLLMQRSILALIDDIQSKHDLTIVFITHDLPLVMQLANHIAVMYAFRFVEKGPTEEILDGAVHPYTRALLNATPNVNAPLESMRAIEGSSPDPVNVPSGCSYHPRCPLADEACEAESPALFRVDDNHGAACFYWDRVEETIPMSTVAEADRETTTGADVTGGGPSSPTSEPVLSLEDVEVHFEQATGVFNFFESGETVNAVDGVSFDITENDIVALVGESGCGKTTLGKAAIGLQRPTGGSVKYRGQDIWDAKDNPDRADIAHDEIREALQIIHQDPGSSLNPNRRVMNSLAEPLRISQGQLGKGERRARILGMLEEVGMTPPEDYASRYPHQLSGGEKQRVALVRALLMNPDVILADEAVSALDVSLRVEMMDLFLSLQDEFDTSFIFISHDLSNARYLAEKAGGRIGVMYLGELVEIGPADRIINSPRHPYTKTLRWATPELRLEKASKMTPLRTIDIQDAVNPPSGCRFHTRCPEAREVCARETPDAVPIEGTGQQAACFREIDDHAYWDSPPIEDAPLQQAEATENAAADD